MTPEIKKKALEDLLKRDDIMAICLNGEYVAVMTIDEYCTMLERMIRP